MSGRLRIACILVAVLSGVLAGTASAQSTGGQSGALAVTVMVVRPCTVTAPQAGGRSPASPAADVRISCGRAPSTSSLLAGGIVPVSGAPAAASVKTTKNAHGLVVAVDF